MKKVSGDLIEPLQNMPGRSAGQLAQIESVALIFPGGKWRLRRAERACTRGKKKEYTLRERSRMQFYSAIAEIRGVGLTSRERKKK